MNVIGMLPKDELAVVAETFVGLTSFKRRVSMQSETVGGPIDVAVISKGDGFIWIKRKHYFESFDNSLLKELCCEIAKITGTSPKLDKLDDEMLSIATKAFATPEKATLEK